MRTSEVADCYEEHGRALVRFAATLVGPSDAEDVVAAALLAVLAADGAEVADPRAYLYRSVVNSAKKHWRTVDRRLRRERLVGAVEVHLDAPVSVDVLRCLAALSPQQRAAVHLAYWEDLTPAAVAARLGVSEGTVRRQLARARRRLREVLDDDR